MATATDKAEKEKINVAYGRQLFQNQDGVLTDAQGKPLEMVSKPGYYQLDNHYYHIRKPGDILHVHGVDGACINILSFLCLAEGDDLRPITKIVFENELANALIDLRLPS